MHNRDLQPDQLCDLLNYVLERPVRGSNGTVMAQAISVCVVRTWDAKRTLPAVENWCDWKLSLEGLSRTKYECKCGPKPVAPPVLFGFLAQQGMKI